MDKKLITTSKYELKYNYYVTEDGQIWSQKTNKYLSQHKDKDGYLKVRLISKDDKRHTYSVHRLVLENFCPTAGMNNLQVNHIDGNKENNSLSNLEWMTCLENIHHAMDNNLRAKINGASKLTKEQVIDIYLRAKNGETNISLGTEYNLHPDSVGRIRNKKSWQNILENFD